jgi:hypothetical protein
MSGALTKEHDKRKAEREQDLEETIEETIRTAGPVNTLAWAGVVLGAFVLNLVMLMLVAQPQ